MLGFLRQPCLLPFETLVVPLEHRFQFVYHFRRGLAVHDVLADVVGGFVQELGVVEHGVGRREAFDGLDDAFGCGAGDVDGLRRRRLCGALAARGEEGGEIQEAVPLLRRE